MPPHALFSRDAAPAKLDLSTLLPRALSHLSTLTHRLLPRQNTMMGDTTTGPSTTTTTTNPDSTNTHNPTTSSTHPQQQQDQHAIINPAIPIGASLGVLLLFLLLTALFIYLRKRYTRFHPTASLHKANRSDSWPADPVHGPVTYYRGGARGGYQELSEVKSTRSSVKKGGFQQRRREAPLPETPKGPPPPPKPTGKVETTTRGTTHILPLVLGPEVGRGLGLSLR